MFIQTTHLTWRCTGCDQMQCNNCLSSVDGCSQPRRLDRARGHLAAVCCLAISLFGPGISSHVITEFFPEAGSISIDKFNSTHPLSAFPCVKARHYEAHGTTVLQRQMTAVVNVSKQNVFTEEIAQRHIRGPAVVV